MLKDFDPIKFLGINKSTLKPGKLATLKNFLNGKIGEYILLKLSNELSEGQLSEITRSKSGTQMLRLLKIAIPNFNTKFFAELENFKKEFKVMVK